MKDVDIKSEGADIKSEAEGAKSEDVDIVDIVDTVDIKSKSVNVIEEKSEFCVIDDNSIGTGE